MTPKTGRNTPCPCGSGKKFKKCCRDVETVRKLKAYNEAVYEVMVKQAREKDPERFDHEQRYAAYHEAGHALMEMLFYGDLKRVSIIPFFPTWDDVENAQAQVQKGQGWNGVGGVCIGVEHDVRSMNDDDWAFHSFQMAAILLAGKAAGDRFCTCDVHIGGDDFDQETVSLVMSNAKAGVKDRLVSAVVAVIQRHGPQLEAIVRPLIEREVLSGDEVRDTMVAGGWVPETDADPDQFYAEALGIAADETADGSINDEEAA
jgi:SEC-C motif